MPSHTASHLCGAVRRHVWQAYPNSLPGRRAIPSLWYKRLYGDLGGTGFIASTLDVAGQPASRPVLIFDIDRWLLVASTRSAADGSYRVTGLNPAHRYCAIGRDDAGEYNTAVADWLTPEVTP